MILSRGNITKDIGKATGFSGGTEKIQASVKNGNGNDFIQSWDVSINSKTFNFSGMSESQLAGLLDFHLIVVNGIADVWEVEEDDGTSYLCRFDDKNIRYSYEQKAIVNGVETNTYNVSFSIKKEPLVVYYD